MRTTILKRGLQAAAAGVALLSTVVNLGANPVMTTLGGGNPHVTPKYLGFKDGITLSQALFHTPSGVAVDGTGQYLYVADRDNNAIRKIDLLGGQTFTFTTNKLSKPVGVALDGNGNVYVLNRGITNLLSTTGSVLEFNQYADLIFTNATGLTNANGIILDLSGNNLYLTVNSNAVMRITGTNKTIVATVTTAGTSLQGLVMKPTGIIAVCDSGRNGILLVDPTSGVVTTNTGFNGRGDYTGVNNGGATPATAQFFQPFSIAAAGDGTLIVADRGNNRVKVVDNNGITTNLCGVSSNYWGGTYPGWYDGTVQVPDSITPNVQERMPSGVAFSSDGTIYVTEQFYHTIRKVTSSGLSLPLPPPPIPPAPRIGWYDYEGNNQTGFFTVLHPVTSSLVFHNDTLLAVDPNTNGVSTYYINGAAPLTGVPSAQNGSTPPFYQDGQSYVQPLSVTAVPDLIVKAVNVNATGGSSPISTAEFIFQVANPVINGNNGAQFTVSDITTNCTLWYTLDGTDPTNAPPSFGPIALTNGNTVTLSVGVTSNVLFQARAFRNGYLPSGIASQSFSSDNFLPNSITFGFNSGEASSDFIASPGQTFYAPVTLSILPGTVMDSLQFNLTVNSIGASAALTPGAYGFESMLMKPITNGPPVIYTAIPPAMYVNGSYTNLETTNLVSNTLSLGWLERYGQTNLFNTLAQSLITYSIAHDDLFPNATQPNGVIVGGYTFQVPANAAPGDIYQIQISRPSATTDGIGEPGSSIFILAPTNGSLGGGAANSVKNVMVGQRKYIAGDSAPFRWFNAGDFGNTNLESADVAQVFEAAIYNLNTPPPGSDLFDSMDSCGYTYVDNGYGYLQKNAVAATAPLYNGNDTTINNIAFGDGVLNVADVYVTYRRSLQTNLVWFQRYWTNDVAHGVSGRVAEIVPNIFNPSLDTKSLIGTKSFTPAGGTGSTDSVTNQPRLTFTAGDFQAVAGQTVQIPVTASIFGIYPLRVLMLNLTVVPLDGSPALTAPVSFSYNPVLGTPWTTEQHGYGNYSAVWLNNAIAGLSNNVTVGTLTVTIPANATPSSAYAVHFDHLSASPNGLAIFPRSIKPGLITLSNRSASSYGDGIPDSWRLRYFLTLNNLLSQTNADADGDGQNNLQEYIAGTDPTDPASNFKNIQTDQSVAQSSQDCVIDWPSVSGKQYIVQRSPSLSTPFWTSISTNNGNGNVMEYHDTTGGGIRFYRVQVQ